MQSSATRARRQLKAGAQTANVDDDEYAGGGGARERQEVGKEQNESRGYARRARIFFIVNAVLGLILLKGLHGLAG